MPSIKHDLITLHWSEGQGSNLAKNKNYAGHWGPFVKKFAKPFVTPEKRKAFDKMTKEQQDDLKKIDGWISGATFDGAWRNKKNLRDRDLMTIDIDYPMAGLLELIDLGLLGMSPFVGLWHSSRRHTPAAPRVRGFFPLSRKATTDEYSAIVRYAAYKIDPEMKTVDPVSFRPAQMMFKPTCSKDDAEHYFFVRQDDDSHAIIDVDAWLEEIAAEFGAWSDLSKLPRHPDEENFRRRADKAEDPLDKAGPVGDFCRAYPDIEVGMEKFLPGVYLPGDEHSGNPRYTYSNSTSSNGAIIYEGKFLYSFHGTDPCAEQLVNLFDLIRIHKFGDSDKKESYDKMSDRPSYKEMMEFAKSDGGYREQVRQRKFGAIYEHFADIEDEPSEDDPEDDAPGGEEDASDRNADDADGGAGDDDGQSGRSSGERSSWESAFDAVEPDNDPEFDRAFEETVGSGPGKQKAPPTGKKRSFERPPKNWFIKRLESNEAGELKATLSNIQNILQFEKRFWGKIGFNEFTQRPVLIGDINPGFQGLKPLLCRDPVNGDPWQDHFDGMIHYILEAERGDESKGYGMKVAISDIKIAVNNVARTNSFHPIREDLDSAVWDSRKRAERLFIDYLGEPDTPYAREVARMFLTAACYRIMTPGQKWDNVLIIQGPQGCRKSTFVRNLFTPQWFGELHVDLGNPQRVAEQIAGIWGCELAELVSMNKTEVNALKTWTRSRKDDCRMAYMQHPTLLPRQLVAIGTTNDPKPLKDPTGNRVFLMLTVHVDRIDTDKLLRDRDQIFAEAMTWYREAREREPYDDLTLDFTSEEAKTEALRRQEGSRMQSPAERLTQDILDWVDQPIKLIDLRRAMGLPIDQFEDESDNDRMVVRNTFREKDMREQLLAQDRFSWNFQADAVIQTVLDKLPGWTKQGGKHLRFGNKHTGLRGTWIDRADAHGEYIRQGYSFVEDDDEDFDPHRYV